MLYMITIRRIWNSFWDRVERCLKSFASGKPGGDLAFSAWLGRNLFRLLSFAVAGGLLLVVNKHLAPGFKERVDKDLTNLIPATKFSVQTVAAPQLAETNFVLSIQPTSITVTNMPQTMTTTNQRSESAVPRVWAYGLQVGAWTALLCAAFWAIVALCRTDH